jgi:hypothetical protein
MSRARAAMQAPVRLNLATARRDNTQYGEPNMESLLWDIKAVIKAQTSAVQVTM